MFKAFVFSTLLFATYNSSIAAEPNCKCNGLAGNLPAVTLIHSSLWGASGLKVFLFQDYSSVDQAFAACMDLKNELIHLGICK